MSLITLSAMVRKDLALFFSDRRSVIVSFVVPIAIASFFGSVFSGASSNNGDRARIDVAVVDHDGSAISQGIVSGAEQDKNLKVQKPTEDEARERVKGGKIPVAVIIPAGFGDAAGKAFFGNGEKPELTVLHDPSRSMELAMVNGVMTQHVMEAVSKQMFTGEQGRKLIDQAVPSISSSSTLSAEQKRVLLDLMGSVQKYYRERPADSNGDAPRGLTMPYTTREEALTAGANIAYNGYAHSFAGMAIQFLLFAMANIGVEMLLERQRGLWGRLRSAPVSKTTLLVGKAASGTVISLMILLVSFAFAIIVFKVRISGSIAGFLGVAIACSVMASTFGLLVAALGNSPATARGVTTLAVLMMVMLGGAWVPTFIFPAWLQQFTLIVPVRWAVDGIDAMTWRGIGLSGALAPSAILIVFAAVFWIVAASRFRWQES